MKIVVAYGGTSPEREVSLNSGKAVYEALSKRGHEVVLEDVLSPKEFVEKWHTFNADGVFIALHGDWGEDGRFQTCLDAYGIPYTGSGPEACMFAMDKTVAKLLFSNDDLLIPEGSIIQKAGTIGIREIKMLEKYGALIVKPNSGGSTVGVTMVKTKEELRVGIDNCWKAYENEEKALVEQYIPGREITVPVWEKENGEAIALPAIDICPRVGFYDYKNKYTSGCTEYICPADFSPEMTKRIGDFAIQAHKSLGCKSYSRVDFRVTEEKPYVLEVNTAPGMTSTSLVPKSARIYGLEFGEFLESLIKVSFRIKRRF